jgi:site-specific recombinase XerC
MAQFGAARILRDPVAAHPSDFIDNFPWTNAGNLRAVQILLGHTKIESTVRYLGVDVEDALALAERTEV